jgi:hypothetical protein
VGEAGLGPASFLLVPASLLAIRVVSGGGGIRTPEGPNGPLRFSRLISFGSTMPSQARCATQRATVRWIPNLGASIEPPKRNVEPEEVAKMPRRAGCTNAVARVRRPRGGAAGVPGTQTVDSVYRAIS